jgi:transketolase
VTRPAPSSDLRHANTANRIRRIILEQSRRAGVGHIGSALSIADILAVLYGGVLKGDHDDPDRDRFVLSKGHAALALYAALQCRGTLDAAQVDEFCSDGTALGAHPEHVVTGIDFSTGSLGQGPSLAVGAALAARMQRSSRRTYALISDAELNEGSVWEAVMFAAHHKLGRLTFVLDLNGQQALGYTRDVIAMTPERARFESFGWNVVEVDGHDHVELEQALALERPEREAPTLVIADTTFGKGVTFMESRIEWHYFPLSDEQYSAAMAELETELRS